MAVLLFAILFGIIDFGVIFNQQNSLSNAARQGARKGVVGQVTCSQVEGFVHNAMSGTLGVTASSVSVKITGQYPNGSPFDPCSQTYVCDNSSAGSAGNADLIVAATYASKPWVPLMYIATPRFSLTTHATYQCEYS